ncbi:MAG: hypothetical protein M3Q24_01355 [bacterium]|nr:hypothetical protein [bacterium]
MNEIKIKIKLSDKQNLKATVVVDFGDFTVKGFRLSHSEHMNENLNGEMLYLQPPSYRAGRSYQKIFYLNDIEVWKELERKVYEEYKIVGKKVEDDIWPDRTI